MAPRPPRPSTIAKKTTVAILHPITHSHSERCWLNHASNGWRRVRGVSRTLEVIWARKVQAGVDDLVAAGRPSYRSTVSTCVQTGGDRRDLSSRPGVDQLNPDSIERPYSRSGD